MAWLSGRCHCHPEAASRRVGSVPGPCQCLELETCARRASLILILILILILTLLFVFVSGFAFRRRRESGVRVRVGVTESRGGRGGAERVDSEEHVIELVVHASVP
eukprot:2046353-Rhodomonas_salina.1